MLEPIKLIMIGFVAGLNSASWGAYKDTPYEPFKFIKYVRSPLLGGVVAYFLYLLIPSQLSGGINDALFFTLIIGIERIATEFRKSFFINEKQDKYNIPQQFAIFGKLVTGRLCRALIGLLLTFLLIIVSIGTYKLMGSMSPISPTLVIIIAACAGFAVAIGGAWKDAPFENFNLLKFFRSPVVCIISAVLYYIFFSNKMQFLFLVSIGTERMVTEFYKTFIKQGPSSKFISASVNSIWAKRRAVFLVPYSISWVVFFYLCFK